MAYLLCILVDVLTTSLAVGIAVLQVMGSEMADPDPTGSMVLRQTEAVAEQGGAGPDFTTASYPLICAFTTPTCLP